MFNKKYKKRYIEFLTKLEEVLDSKKSNEEKVQILKNYIWVERIIESLEEL
jgi:hypothetical protein